MSFLVVLTIGWLTGCTGPPFSSMTVVDLTHPFDQQTIYWPNNKHFERHDTKRGFTSSGYWYASGEFAASEHGGTHIDAPIHFAASGIGLDEIPVSKLVVPAVTLDVRRQCREDPDYELTVPDVKEWESRHGLIPVNTLVFMWTGWGARWPDPTRYLGSPTPGDSKTLHFPGFSANVIEFLVTKREIRGIGIDTASIDPGRSQEFPAHRILSEANRYAIENVAGLDHLPPKGATVVALPVKIKGGTGGPVRVIAFIP